MATLADAADWVDVDDTRDCFGTLTANGFVLWQDWVRTLSLEQLLPGWEQLRGGDVPLPGTTPEQGLPRRPEATRIDVPFLVLGRYTTANAEAADPEQQLIDNLAQLRTNLAIGTQVGDGTVACVHTWPNGTTKSASCHVYPFRPSVQPGYFARCVLTLNVLGGRFV